MSVFSTNDTNKLLLTVRRTIERYDNCGPVLLICYHVPVHTLGKPFEGIRLRQEIERVEEQMAEQMLRIRRRDDQRRAVAQVVQKRHRYEFIGRGQPEKDKRPIGRLQADQHFLRERPGLTQREPAGTLEVLGELAPTRH